MPAGKTHFNLELCMVQLKKHSLKTSETLMSWKRRKCFSQMQISDSCKYFLCKNGAILILYFNHNFLLLVMGTLTYVYDTSHEKMFILKPEDPVLLIFIAKTIFVSFDIISVHYIKFDSQTFLMTNQTTTKQLYDLKCTDGKNFNQITQKCFCEELFATI